MDEAIDDNKIESQPPIIHDVEDSIASRTKEITQRAKREPIQILPPAPKIKKGQRAQQRIFGPIRRFYYRTFRTVSKLCTFTEGFDKKPTIFVLHQLIRNGNAFLRVKG
ncbi:unnamed protein product [Rotaria sordida]|uniref:Uncharacterized protein n=1 Tax=Rotaria sordida TaxID=392033 RepID=A0A814PT51_9BILA|nr:unnamed protein product [Rotaria sordida]CAF1320665.1 unnamed protein product [Rotaria sordida]